VTPATTEGGSHFWPQFVGDGRHFVYAAALTHDIRLGSLTGEPSRVLMRTERHPSALGYAPGYLFFGRESRLFARAFDEATQKLTSEPIELMRDLPITQLGRMPFSVSAAGPLAVWPYAGGTPAILQWFDAAGPGRIANDRPARYIGLALSADGRRLAVSRRNAENVADVWIRDLDGSAEAQVTFDGLGVAPRWSTDGRRLAFTTTAKLPPRPFVRSLDPPGADRQLDDAPTPMFVSSWCRDGERLVGVRIDPATRDDLYVLHVNGGRADPLPINTAANEYQGVVSPDDRWLAYVTDVSGRDEVWVASFPSGRGRRQVSVDGGSSPQWTDGGRALAFLSERKRLTVRSFAGAETGVTLGEVQELFDASAFVETTPLVTPTANAYAAAVDGRRFLAAVRANDPGVPPIQLVANWRTLLTAR
jgi:dipeptidyl aminopeptidase/acylaminoacyl peptidase